MSQLLAVGQTAPDFTLPCAAPASAGEAEQTLSLRDFKGKNVVLAFYPADWSAVCGDELAIFNEMLPMFQKLDADVVGISVDSAFCHAAFIENRGFRMSLLADFEPKGAVSKQYGVYDEKQGISERALFVIDAQGIIRYSFISPMDVNPGASALFKTLKEIQNQGEPMNQNDLTVPASADDHSQGDADAPVTLVEYGDYECPYCSEAAQIVEQVQARMGDKLRLVFRNFPLAQIHPYAQHAALAAEAAAEMGQFWPMHDLLYQNQQQLTDDDLMGYADQLGLDRDEFAAKINGSQASDKVQADFESGAQSGVNGTPSFFINGARFDGNWQGDDLLQALQAASAQ